MPKGYECGMRRALGLESLGLLLQVSYRLLELCDLPLRQPRGGAALREPLRCVVGSAWNNVCVCVCVCVE